MVLATEADERSEDSTLHGTADLERTRGFYARIGYEREALIREYYDTGDDKVVFRKAL